MRFYLSFYVFFIFLFLVIFFGLGFDGREIWFLDGMEGVLEMIRFWGN